MNRTVLQMRRMIKMTGMRINFLSAMEVRGGNAGALERMGRYSESAACFRGGWEGDKNVNKKLHASDI